MAVLFIVKYSKNPEKKLGKKPSKRSKMGKCRSHYISNGILNRLNFCCKQCLGGSN
jgi:hypothetical protein